jgi:uncharacterized 2Fe-2S/4Fe-4S cluster protein (DUF4445 family)
MSETQKHTIIFQPSGLSAQAEHGATLSDAAIAAGVAISLPCGGQGRCGRCKVIVNRGDVDRKLVGRLTATELEQGYALACQTRVLGDLEVFVPPIEEILIHRLPTEKGSEKAYELPIACNWASHPTLRKVHVRIDPPSLLDNTTDFERLSRELARQYDIRDLTVDLPTLRRLAKSLRGANWDVTATLEMHTWTNPDGPPRLLDVVPGDQTQTLYGIAVDIGTTSNVVYLVDMVSGKVVDTASAYNMQISCGEDVISRIIYARKPGGLDHLQRLVVQTLNGLIEELAKRNDIATTDIHKMTVAGNTTMTHLFLGLDPEAIRLEPYIPTITHPSPVRAHELGMHINPDATVDCLPGVGAYVGGDITAGVLSSKLFATDKLSLFIDVGTNGEIVLGNSDWLISCACSAGPAFEGAGVRSGMRATVGAVEEVWISAKTAEPTYRTIGDAPPEGICGSGMISLMAEMFISGVMDKGGKLNRTLATPRIRVGEHGPEYIVAGASETRKKAEDIVITEVDIANLIRAKAAIYAGFSVLTHSVGIELADVEQVLIGGAFGKYIDVEKAIQIGLLPDMPWDRFQYLGNTSALGAYAALLCSDMRAAVVDIASKMTYLELSADNSFMDQFTSALFLPHTDTASFPSVMRLLESVGQNKEPTNPRE